MATVTADEQEGEDLVLLHSTQPKWVLIGSLYVCVQHFKTKHTPNPDG